MRSTFNVGSLFRTAEGMGVKKLYLTGYTPYPTLESDARLPHIANKLDRQIQKTSLDSQLSLDWEHNEDIYEVITSLKDDNVDIVALEQTDSAIKLNEFSVPSKVALILGTEVTGLPKEIIEKTDYQLVIPMFGKKESFNVVQAAAMAMYHLRFN